MGQEENFRMSPLCNEFSGGVNKSIYEKRKLDWIFL